MAQKLTDWFPADVKPVHVGAYEVILVLVKRDNEQTNPDGYAHWDGHKWLWTSATVAQAAHEGEASNQKKRWRGLASDPSKGAV